MTASTRLVLEEVETMKRFLAAGSVAAAFMFLAIPAAATATWSHDHGPFQADDGTLTITGDIGFEGEEIGGVECQVTSMATLAPETGTGLVESFHPDTQGSESVTDNCKVDPVLDFFGCSDVASVTADALPWTLHATTTNTTTVTTGAIQVHLHGGVFCPKTIQLTPGTVTLTVPHGQRNTIKEGTLSGQLQGHGGVTQNVQLTGSGTLTQGSGTYGIEGPAPFAWSHDHGPFQADGGTLTITGDVGFESEEIGGVECQVTSMATLTPETGTGLVESFHPDTQGGESVTDNCKVDPVLDFFGCSDVASVTADALPWTLHATTTNTTTVTTGAIQVHLHGGVFCPKTIQLTPGTVTLTVPHGQRNTIKEGTLSGELQGHGAVTQSVQLTGSGSLTQGSGRFGIEGPAPFTWSHDHGPFQADDGTLTITGDIGFEGEFIGGVECQVTSMATLAPETGTGLVESFHPDTQGSESVTDNCKVDPVLEFVGCTDVASVTADALPWTLHATTTNTITVTTGTIQTHLHGGAFCPKTIQLTPGNATLTVPHGQRNTIKEGTLSGELQGHGAVTQSVQLTGSGSLTQGSGTYGTEG